jgi:hypothetical protein
MGVLLKAGTVRQPLSPVITSSLKEYVVLRVSVA